MYTLQKLPTGLQVLTARITGTASVTAMVFAKAGSRYEAQPERGISHFLEHMFFKGGKKYRTTKEVSAAIDGIGGDFNAFTGKEYAGYYVKVRSTHTDLACDVLSDMLLHATFPQEEIEKERGVIMEEERMYQDTPMYRAGWDFEQLLYGDHPLGWDTIGLETVIRSVNQKDFLHHQRALYTVDNAVLTFAGNITEEESMNFAEHFFGGVDGTCSRSFEPLKHYGNDRVFLRTKNTEQTHIVIGVPALPARHKDHVALRLLSVALGGNMSSRMFLNVREAKGLCYYISTEIDAYLDAGSLSTRAGVDQNRMHEAISAIVEQYKLCAASGIAADELMRAKEFLKGKMSLGLEDSEELAHFFGKQLLLYPQVYDIEEEFQRIDAVTLEQVNAIAKKLLQPKALRAVVIGKEKNQKAIEEMLGW